MKVVPFITNTVFGTGLLLSFISLRTNWSETSTDTLMQGHVNLNEACLSLHSPGRTLGKSRELLAPQCIDLNAESMTRLFALNADANAVSHARLFIAARAVYWIATALATVAWVFTLMQSFSAYYHRAWAVIPLVASIASMVLGILTCSFFAEVNKKGFRSGSSIYPARLSSGFTLCLLATICWGLCLVPSIIDLAIPHTREGFPSVPSTMQKVLGGVVGGQQQQRRGSSGSRGRRDTGEPTQQQQQQQLHSSEGTDSSSSSTIGAYQPQKEQ